jgi:hypothetical protein
MRHAHLTVRASTRTRAPLHPAGRLAIALAGFALACTPAEQPAHAPAADERAPTAPAAPVLDMAPEDSVIFRDRYDRAIAEGWDRLPLGATIVRIAETFVGAPYVPGTLEAEGPERLIVNLRVFDCVTLVESVLALARVVHARDPDFHAFTRELARFRYRDGEQAGYPSRLHYFSEWISDNERRGLVRNITAELGGVPYDEPVNFMSRNVTAYRQLGAEPNLRAIEEIEARLAAEARFRIPQESIARVASGIEDGDVIAATSSIEGLDIAHTGFAIWRDGRLHLLHAPLVGSVVEISERPLADRIGRLTTQHGIMVARPR